jgi:hypothetical protein
LCIYSDQHHNKVSVRYTNKTINKKFSWNNSLANIIWLQCMTFSPLNRHISVLQFKSIIIMISHCSSHNRADSSEICSPRLLSQKMAITYTKSHPQSIQT